MPLSKSDLSTYNTAESPWIQVAPNGKVDIGVKQGENLKVGLSEKGMYKLVNDWLVSDVRLNSEEKENLIRLLQSK